MEFQDKKGPILIENNKKLNKKNLIEKFSFETFWLNLIVFPS